MGNQHPQYQSFQDHHSDVNVTSPENNQTLPNTKTIEIKLEKQESITDINDFQDPQNPRDSLAKSPSLKEKKKAYTFDLLKNTLYEENGSNITRRNDGVNAIVSSSDGKEIASCSSDTTITIWHFNSKLNKYIRKQILYEHEKAVVCLAWSSEITMIDTKETEKKPKIEKASYLASGSNDQQVILWEAKPNEGFQKKKNLRFSFSLVSVVFSPNSLSMATCCSSESIVQVWNLNNLETHTVVKAHAASVSVCCLFWNTSYLVFGCSDGVICFYETQKKGITRKYKFNDYDYAINGISISSDGKFLVAGNEGGDVLMWNLEVANSECDKLCDVSKFVTSIAWSPKNDLIALGSKDDEAVVVLRPQKSEDQEENNRIEYEKYKIISANDDEDLIVNHISWKSDSSGLFISCNDNSARFWKLEDKLKFKCSFNISTICYSSKLKRMIIGLEDGLIEIVNPKEKKEKQIEGKLTGHEDYVRCIALSPNENSMVSGSDDKTIRIWDLKKLKEIKKISGHKDIIRSVSWCPDNNSKMIASTSNDKTLRIWNFETGDSLHAMTDENVNHQFVLFSLDGKKLFCSTSCNNDYKILIYDKENFNKVPKELNLDGNAIYFKFSPDGQKIALIEDNNDTNTKIRIFDLKHDANIEIMKIDPNLTFESVIWIDGGKKLAAGANDYTVRIYDSSNGIEIKKFTNFSDDVMEIVEGNPADKELAAISQDRDSFCIWSWSELSDINKLSGHNGLINSIARDPSTDSQKMVSAGDDGIIRLWNNYEGEEMPIGTVEKRINIVVWSYNGKLIASGGDDCMVSLWKLSGSSINSSLLATKLKEHTNSIKALSWSPNNQYLVSGGGDKLMIIWDVDRETKKKINDKHGAEINCLAWSKDGNYICSCSGSVVWIWKPFEDVEIKKITMDDEESNQCVEWAADSKTIFIGGSKLVEYDLDPNNNDPTRIFDDSFSENIRYLSLSNDGHMLFSASDSAFTWNVDDGTKINDLKFSVPIKSAFWTADNKNIIIAARDAIKTLESESKLEKVKDLELQDKVRCISLHRDGKYFAVATEDKKLEIFNGNKSMKLWDFQEKQYTITCVCWGNDTTLFTGGSDKIVRKWSIQGNVETEIESFSKHKKTISCIDCSLDENFLASGSVDLMVIIWNLKDRTMIINPFYHEKPVLCLSWSPNSQNLLSGSQDGIVKLIEFHADETEQKFIESPGSKDIYHDGPITSMAWKPKDGSRFVSCDNDCLKIWDFNHLIEIKSIQIIPEKDDDAKEKNENLDNQQQNNEVQIQSFLKVIWMNNNTLFTIGEDDYFRVWDVECGVQIKKLTFGFEDPNMKMDASGDGNVVFVHNDQGKIFDYYTLWTSDEDWEMFEFYFEELQNIKTSEGFEKEKIKRLINYRFGGFTTIFHLLWGSDNFNALKIVMDFCKKNNIYPECFPLDSNNKSVFSYINLPHENEKIEKQKEISETIDLFINFIIESKIKLGCISSEENMLSKIYKVSGSTLLIEFLNSRFQTPSAQFGKVLWENNQLESVSDTFFSDNVFQKESLIKTESLLQGVNLNPENNNQTTTCNVLICDLKLELFNQTFFQEISDSPNFEDMCSKSKIILMVLDLCWKKYGKNLFYKNFLYYLIFLVILTINSIWIVPEIIESDERNEAINIFFVIFNIMLLVFITFLSYREYGEMKRDVKLYFQSFWNLVDLLIISMNYISSIFNFFIILEITDDFVTLRVILSICYFFSFFRVFDLFRGVREACFFIENVKEIMNGMKVFLVLLICFMINCCCSVYILQTDYSIGIFNSMYYFYRLLLTDFDLFDEFVSPSQWMVLIFFLFSTAILVIVMMNVLIAIILDAYQNLNQKKDIIYENNRMKIMSEIERYDSQNIRTKINDQFLIAIFKNDHGIKTTTLTDLAGDMKNIRKELDEFRSTFSQLPKNSEKKQLGDEKEDKSEDIQPKKNENEEIFKQLVTITESMDQLKDNHNELKNENEDLRGLIKNTNNELIEFIKNNKNDNQGLIALIVEEVDKRLTEKIAKSMESIKPQKKK